MGREIKFRCWDYFHNKFVPTDDVIRFGNNGGLQTLHPQIRLMQFTGLHDNNGKEIWEGDYYKIGVFEGEIFYDEEYAQFQISTKGGRIALVQSERDWMSGTLKDQLIGEVLGNIYENPSLLEEK